MRAAPPGAAGAPRNRGGNREAPGKPGPPVSSNADMLQSADPPNPLRAMASPNLFEPAGTNLLGEALVDSRQRFRQLVASLDALVKSGRIEEGRTHLKKLSAMQTELHRLLNPRDEVDQKALAQIDRDVRRLQQALKKGWGGAVGTGLLAVLVAGVLGVAALLWLMWKFLG